MDDSIQCGDAVNVEDWMDGRRPPLPPEEETAFFQRLIKDWTGIPEMVQFTFTFRDIPEALLGQLARHRFGKLFVRSARVFPAGTFAEEGRFFRPDSCSDKIGNVEAYAAYESAMLNAQTAYKLLTEAGVPLEDARGVMPMHAFYDMTFTMDLKSLCALIQKRSCLILQQQYWAPLLAAMRDELCSKVDNRLGYIFAPPCKFRGACISPMEQELRATGKDPNEPCPLYIELWGEDHTIEAGSAG
jgi:thymidylate synthase ThyX